VEMKRKIVKYKKTIKDIDLKGKKEIKYTHKFYRKGMIKMKIAIINENSQVTKNKIIYDALKPIADKKGYEIYNCNKK